jgi:putative aldouronate transport system substrate-binding protein
MKKATKAATLLTAALFIAGSTLTGCAGSGKSVDTGEKPDPTSTPKSGETESKALDTSKKAELVMYLIGAPAKEYDLVLEEANKKLKEDLNASLKVNWIGWADYNTQYPLLLASGDPIDVIYASTWTNFYTNAKKGAFTALEKLAPVYAPKTYAQITPDFMEESTLDGHLYGVPAQFYQIGAMGYILRGDLMDKYGIKAIESMDDYGKYLDAVVKNDPQLVPNDQISSSDGLDTYYAEERGYYNILKTQFSPFYVNAKDDTHKIINLYETEGVLDYFKKMKEWGDKGYWSKSILSNKDEKMFENGKAASRLHNQDSFKGAYMEHPDWDVRYYHLGSYTYKTAAMQDGMAIPASAKNPERALMFLELLRTNESYYDLFTYGIKDKHYQVTEKGNLKPLDMDAFSPEGYCSWGFKSPEFFKPLEGMPPTWDSVQEMLKGKLLDNKFVLFNPDFEPVKNEVAAVNNVIQQYRIPLSFGYIKNPEEGLNTLVEKMKTAGSDKIIEEMQRQLDGYLGIK